MLLELAVGAAETVLGAKACRWVRVLAVQAEANQAAVFQAADPFPIARAVRRGAVQAARKACCEAGSRRSSLRRRRSRLRLRRWSSPVRSSTRMSAAPP